MRRAAFSYAVYLQSYARFCGVPPQKDSGKDHSFSANVMVWSMRAVFQAEYAIVPAKSPPWMARTIRTMIDSMMFSPHTKH